MNVHQLCHLILMYSMMTFQVSSLYLFLSVFWGILLILSCILLKVDYTDQEIKLNDQSICITYEYIRRIATSRELDSFEFEYIHFAECPNIHTGILSQQFWLILFFSIFTFCIFNLIIQGSIYYQVMDTKKQESFIQIHFLQYWVDYMPSLSL